MKAIIVHLDKQYHQQVSDLVRRWSNKSVTVVPVTYLEQPALSFAPMATLDIGRLEAFVDGAIGMLADIREKSA